MAGKPKHRFRIIGNWISLRNSMHNFGEFKKQCTQSRLISWARPHQLAISDWKLHVSLDYTRCVCWMERASVHSIAWTATATLLPGKINLLAVLRCPVRYTRRSQRCTFELNNKIWAENIAALLQLINNLNNESSQLHIHLCAVWRACATWMVNSEHTIRYNQTINKSSWKVNKKNIVLDTKWNRTHACQCCKSAWNPT